MVIALVVLLVAIVMIVFEVRSPGRKWGKVQGWWLRAALLNGFQVLVVYLAGISWDGWMQQHRPFSADGLGPVLGGVIGYVAITFIYYWWHRWRHAFPVLWRGFHQVHHSPSRIEIITTFYKHPVEILVNGLLSSAILYWMVGLGTEAAMGGVLLSGLAELFYHWNVRTPYLVGFLFQRPESHCVHHMRGLHSYNYGDLPLWDMLFGTFHNPKGFDAECGFEPDEERKLVSMLLCQDVTAPTPEGKRPS